MQPDPAAHRSLCLTPEEIEEITQKRRYSAQRRALRALGLDLKPRADGSILLDRSIYEAWLRGGRNNGESQGKTVPKWDRINGSYEAKSGKRRPPKALEA